MALITDQPEDLESSNDLDRIEDPDSPEFNEYGSIDRFLAFGTTPKALAHPPKDGEIVTYQVKVECIGQAHKRRADGEVRYRSELSILSVARVGEELPPDFAPEPTAAQKRREEKARAAAEQAEKDEAERAEAESNEPPMFDEDGEPVSIDAPRPPADPDGVVDAEIVEDDDVVVDGPWPGDADHQDGHDGVDRPGFSDAPE